MNRQLALGIGEQRQSARLAGEPRHVPTLGIARGALLVDYDPPILMKRRAAAGAPTVGTAAHNAVVIAAAALEHDTVDAHAAGAKVLDHDVGVVDARGHVVGANEDDLDVLARLGGVAPHAGQRLVQDGAPVRAVLAQAGLALDVVAGAEQLGAREVDRHDEAAAVDGAKVVEHARAHDQALHGLVEGAGVQAEAEHHRCLVRDGFAHDCWLKVDDLAKL